MNAHAIHMHLKHNANTKQGFERSTREYTRITKNYSLLEVTKLLPSHLQYCAYIIVVLFVHICFFIKTNYYLFECDIYLLLLLLLLLHHSTSTTTINTTSIIIIIIYMYRYGDSLHKLPTW